jgi:hypothetical protein
VIMGSAAPSLCGHAPDPQITASMPEPQLQREAPQVLPARPATTTADSVGRLQNAVLQALTDGNQRILVSMLEAGEWSVEGNEVVIKISESQTVVDMSLGAEARRLAVAAASGILGRPARLKVVPGTNLNANGSATEMRNSAPIKPGAANSGIGGRGRAEQDAVVRRMQEKFGAQIRTVIDYKEKR